MKKILCMLLIFTLLMSACLIGVSAEVIADNDEDAANTVGTATEDEADKWLFYQKFRERFDNPDWDKFEVVYEELYYHYDSQGNVEWALICGYIPGRTLWTFKICAVLEDRVIRGDRVMSGPFCTDYGIYDVTKQEVIDLASASEEEKYHDEIFAYLDENNIGEIIGDMDNDRKVTVKDATYIQKCVASIIEFPENDAVSKNFYYSEGYGYLAYLSDFNRDKVRNVKDATAIQKYVAGITY